MTSVEECIASELRSLHHYIVNSEETLLTAVAKEEGIFKEQVEGKEEYKKRVDAEKKEEVESMKLHGQFERDTKDLKTEESWNWLSKGYLKRETESLITSAQDQALNTNSIKKSIYLTCINIRLVLIFAQS